MAADEKSTRDMGHLVAALDQLVGTVRRRDPAHSSHGQTAGDGTLGRRTSPCSSALFTPVDSVLLFDRAEAERVPLTLELRTAPSCLRLLLRTLDLWLLPSGPPPELLRVAAIVATLPLRWGLYVKAIELDLKLPQRTAERACDARGRLGGLRRRGRARDAR